MLNVQEEDKHKLNTMKEITLLLLLIPILGLSQVKIDSLGLHIINDYHVIEVPDKSANEIYNKTIEFLSKNNDSILDKKADNYLKFEVTNNYISYLRRHGKDGHIGHTSQIEMEFKGGKCRIKSISPTFYLIYGSQSIKPKFVSEKKKKSFVIFGKGPSLYDNEMLLRKPGRMAKPKMENYFNDWIKDVSTYLNKSDKDEW